MIPHPQCIDLNPQALEIRKVELNHTCSQMCFRRQTAQNTPKKENVSFDPKCPLGREPPGSCHIPDWSAPDFPMSDVVLLPGSLSFCSWQLHCGPAPRHSWGLQTRKDVPIWRCSNYWKELGDLKFKKRKEKSFYGLERKQIERKKIL